MLREAQHEKADKDSANVAAPNEPNGAPNWRERVRRFSVRMPMRYRMNGEDRWRGRGRTENVSRSGVLFRAELAAALNTPIEISMALPGSISGNGAAEVVCRGTIVRVEATPAVESQPALATTISQYRLVRH